MNTEELKLLAEAATPGPWDVKEELSGTVYADDIPVAATIRHSPKLNTLSQSQKRTNTLYLSAANPAAILELIRQRDELLAALKDARELVDDWGAYAPAYMQEKHDLAGDLDRLNAAIAKAEG